MRWSFLVFSLLLVGCATHYVPPTKGGATLDYIQQDGEQFGWSGIYLGDTLEAVEKKTGQTLTPYPDGYPACGSLSANLTLQERKVILQLDSHGKTTLVQSIDVTLPSGEQGLSMLTMADTLEQRFPKLTVKSSDADSIELMTPDHQAILLKNNKEHFLDVTHAGCID